MTEDILDGISLAIAAAFPGYPVYGDSRVRQGLEAPCFFVGLGEYSRRPLPCEFFEVRQAVDVVYFPQEREDYKEMWRLGPRMLPLLGELSLPDGTVIRGTALRCDIVDGLMHMRAVYKLRLQYMENPEIMEELAVRTRLGR